MARSKGRKFAEYKHPTYGDVKVEIKLFPDGWFTADYGTQHLKNQSFEALKKELTKVIDDLYSINWYPVILVKINPAAKAHAHGRVVNIRFEVQRLWLGYYNNHYYEAHFKDPHGDQFAYNNGDEFAKWAIRTDKPSHERWFGGFGRDDYDGIVPNGLPYTTRDNSGSSLTVIMNYNQNAWDNLVEMREVLHRITHRILDLVWQDEDKKELGLLFQPDLMLPAFAGLGVEEE